MKKIIKADTVNAYTCFGIDIVSKKTLKTAANQRYTHHFMQCMTLRKQSEVTI